MTITFLHFFKVFLIFLIFFDFFMFFYVFLIFFDFFLIFLKLCHRLEIFLGVFHGGELDVNPIHVLLLGLAIKNQCLVINVHNRLGNGPHHHLQTCHFQGRGILDVPDDALGSRLGALLGFGHANGINRIAGLVLGVPGLGGGQGHHAGHPFCVFENFGSFESVFFGTFACENRVFIAWALPGSNDFGLMRSGVK